MSIVPRNLNLPFLLLLGALAAAIAVAAETGVDPRLVSVLLGTTALGGFSFRLITTWTEVPVLVHVLSLVIIAFLLIGAVGQLQLTGSIPGPLKAPAPLTIAVWPGIILRATLVVICLFWPEWVDRRTSPFRTS